MAASAEVENQEDAGETDPTADFRAAAGQSLSRNSTPNSVSPCPRPQDDYFSPTPSLEPPVTRNTLSELDVNKIIHNPKLRHDINFDPELHFRPNLDGEKGKKKKDRADIFWATLKQQLTHFALDRDSFNKTLRRDEDWCLPMLLKAVKDIITTLVPARDRDLLSDGLNIELLMQQFNRGVADLEKLASWLSSVLKLHCAPMRDEWVDRMYRHLSNGNRHNDIDDLVTGLRELLSVLEAMKLDVANHQIRCLRPVLIEDTVHFEQRFFRKKIQTKKLSIVVAHAWYRDGCAQLADSPEKSQFVQAFGDSAAFFFSLTNMMLPSTTLEPERTPRTFLFDDERISKIRSDLLDTICLEICMRKFDELEQLSSISPVLASDATETPGSRWSLCNFNAHPTSRPSSWTFSDRGSDTSSRPSSGFLGTLPLLSDPAESRAKCVALHDSLLALLHTAAPPVLNNSIQRWRDLAQSMALQIMRYVDVPPAARGSFASFEAALEADLCNPQGDLFRQVEAAMRQRLLASLAKSVKEFKKYSGVGIFSVATGGRVNGPARAADPGRERVDRDPGGFASAPDSTPISCGLRDEDCVDELAVRLAHVGILHWRVWSELVYLVEPDVEDAQG
ncbi:hypothetical protein P8C59_005422 [Phyllachora maydis]|uniref:T-complex 11 n=1 Tax=Phyllachora maydis TaxID=1825666 RepID=A0AAD9MBF3_9PEZI|nr:hypothetical protein P8C59_005422 [Phyllachora maydis]